MSGLRTFCIVLAAASGIFSACATTPATSPGIPSEDALTPGIFLEPESRAALPPGVTLRKVYEPGIQATKQSEGFRSRLYNDVAGYCTIAYGHLIKRVPCDGGEPEEFRRGLSEPRGSELLVKDMEGAQRWVMTIVAVDLTDGQFAALCDFVFNVGGGNLKTSTLLQVINARQFDRVPFQFRRWVMAGGKEVTGLKARREREIDLFFDGLPRPKAAPPPDEDLSPIDIRKGEGATTASGPGIARPLAAAGAGRTGHALLIGIGDYSASGLDSLKGPRNDVELVHRLLRTRFGLREDNIIVLVDQQATHTRVQTAFRDMTQRVQPGDFVYIHYSGHGSYTEDKTERSGEDQTWVTFGARSKTSTGLDDHDVLDKEIGQWLMPLYEKTTDLVFVSDSCHSATVSRGLAAGVRAAPPDPRPHPLLARPLDSPASLPGIRIGAARDVESAVEIDVDRGGQCLDASRCQGVFTWYWVQALQQARPGERWDDVFKRAYTLVTVQRGVSQRPQLEGNGEAVVFGAAFAALTPTVAVTEVDAASRTVVFAAGATNGVTKGSTYKLFDAQSPDRPDLPTFDVVGIRPFSGDGVIRGGRFNVGDLVIESAHAYRSEPWKLYVSGDFAQGIDQGLIARVGNALGTLPGFEVTTDNRLADWVVYIVRPGKEGAEAARASGPPKLPTSFPDQAPEAWVISPQGQLLHDRMRIALADPDKGIAALKENLTRFAHASEVKRLESHAGPAPVDIEIAVWRSDPSCRHACGYLPSDTQQEKPYTQTGTYTSSRMAPPLNRGNALTFVLRNQDPEHKAWYAYLLDIGPDSSIQTIFPLRHDNREEALLRAGETRPVSPWLVLDAPGVEVIKLIVTREPIDPQLLETSGYLEIRGGPTNPLERLLAQAVRSRGELVRADANDWSTAQAEFQVGQ